MKHLRIIAAKEFSDRFRSGWVLISTAIWLGAISMTSLFGMIQIGRVGFQGYERTIASLLNLIQYLVPLLGLLLGHDLIVTEKEERTFALFSAMGIARIKVLAGKFIGTALVLAVPLLAGFLVSGAVIRFEANDTQLLPFAALAGTGLLLGVVFIGVGLMISAWSQTRIQALVCALLAWGFALFVYDLAALGALVAFQTPAAAREIEIACDATHINSGADLHAAIESESVKPSALSTVRTQSHFLPWLLCNPVDLFRLANLPGSHLLKNSYGIFSCILAAWLLVPLTLSLWRFQHIDL